MELKPKVSRVYPYPIDRHRWEIKPPVPGITLEGILVDPIDGRPSDHAEIESFDKIGRLALLCLSCFRRTRNLVALRSILAPLVNDVLKPLSRDPYETVDKILDWFQRAEYLLPVAGGGYWMNRTLRDGIYSLNSQSTSTTAFKSFIEAMNAQRTLAASTDDLIRSTLQSLLLSLHHDRIAHYFYFHNYTQSQDSFAFFEYVYHCVSSIRYLTRIVLLRRIVSRDNSGLWERVSTFSPTELKKVSAGYLNVTTKELDSIFAPEGVREIVTLEDRRLREIAGLRLSWRRSRAMLLRTVPAEQIIQWCECLIIDDLPRFLASTYGLKLGADASVLQELDSRPVCDEVNRLESDLFDLWAGSYRGRSDYRQCINLRLLQQVRRREPRRPSQDTRRELEAAREEAQNYWVHLHSDPMSVVETFPPEEKPPPATIPPDEKTYSDRDSLDRCRWWLDIVECLIGDDELSVGGRKSGFKNRSGLLEWLAKYIENLLDPHGRSARDTEARALRFRLRVLETEHYLVMIKSWRLAEVLADLKKTPELTGDKVYLLCRESLIELQRRYDLDEGRAYFDFRGRIPDRLPGRHCKRPFRDGSLSFVEAYRDLELARGGRPEGDRLLRASSDLYGTRLALMEADALLTPTLAWPDPKKEELPARSNCSTRCPRFTSWPTVTCAGSPAS